MFPEEIFALVFLFVYVSGANVASCYKGTNQLTGRHEGPKELCENAMFCYSMTGRSPYNKSPTRGCGSSLADRICQKFRPTDSAESWCFHVNETQFSGQLCCCASLNCNFAKSLWTALPLFVTFLVVLA